MENGNTIFKRPENVPYPSVWKRFKGKREINGVIPSFWVQDIPEDQFEDALDFIMSGFPVDEPLNKYSGLTNDDESMESLRSAERKIIYDKLALICYAENPEPNGKPIIAGINTTFAKSKHEGDIQIKGETIEKVFDALETVNIRKDAFQELGTNVLMNALGLYVSPEFRGQGIGIEIVKAREDLCKAVGIKAIITTFTSIASQKIAEKVGYKILDEISYEEIKKSDNRLNFPGLEKHTKMIKCMYKIV
ncbi:hypothetical protein FQA39_LY11960 [Lamprigera yunnana]|nr:hypothetical protein FQA39_LY11960 [Lamprigera yunnana]